MSCSFLRYYTVFKTCFEEGVLFCNRPIELQFCYLFAHPKNCLLLENSRWVSIFQEVESPTQKTSSLGGRTSRLEYYIKQFILLNVELQTLPPPLRADSVFGLHLNPAYRQAFPWPDSQQEHQLLGLKHKRRAQPKRLIHQMEEPQGLSTTSSSLSYSM